MPRSLVRLGPTAKAGLALGYAHQGGDDAHLRPAGELTSDRMREEDVARKARTNDLVAAGWEIHPPAAAPGELVDHDGALLHGPGPGVALRPDLSLTVFR